MQVDPVGYDADLNLYIYGKNDPNDKTDPTGRFAGVDDAVVGTTAVVVGTIAVVYCELSGCMKPLINWVHHEIDGPSNQPAQPSSGPSKGASGPSLDSSPVVQQDLSPADVGGGTINELRGKNWLPDKGTPGTTVTNPPGTGQRRYGPDGHPDQDWNAGHPGAKPPENDEHVHDHTPNPHNPTGKPTRQPGRVPDQPGDLRGPGRSPNPKPTP